MSASCTSRLSVSTWSLHRTLGLTYVGSPGHSGARDAQETFGKGSISLIDLPAEVARFGIGTMEICHFQIPSLEPAYLCDLKQALAASGVKLLSLLVDAGDITHPDHHDRDLAWVRSHIEVAAMLGAERARVIAGKSEYSPEAMAVSIRGLQELANAAADAGVRVTTENWYPLLSRPEHLLHLLDSLEGRIGLNFDFGNWEGVTKYEHLAAIAPRAETTHAKCHFDTPFMPDRVDYVRCLEILRASGFTGTQTLVYDGPDDDEWRGLTIEREMVLPYLA